MTCHPPDPKEPHQPGANSFSASGAWTLVNHQLMERGRLRQKSGGRETGDRHDRWLLPVMPPGNYASSAGSVMDSRTCGVCGATSTEVFCTHCGSLMPARAEGEGGTAAPHPTAPSAVVRLEKPVNRRVRLEKPGGRTVRLEKPADRAAGLQGPADRTVRLDKPSARTGGPEMPADPTARLEKPTDRAPGPAAPPERVVSLEKPAGRVGWLPSPTDGVVPQGLPWDQGERIPAGYSSQPSPYPMVPPAAARPAKRWLIPGVAVVGVIGAIIWAIIANVPAAPTALPSSGTTVAVATRSSTSSATTEKVPAAPATSVAIPTSPSLTAEDLARQELNQEVQLYVVNTDNHYLVELAAKWVGATDPQLTAANGSHTFYASDIMAEYRTIKAQYGSSVHLVLSSTFGKQTVNGKIPQGEPLYVTVYDPGTFDGKDSAVSWCSAQFPQASGASLDNLCLARPASPPHT
jgi:hypothetical protein